MEPFAWTIPFLLAFVGGLIAFLSTILGIGGGIFTVPLLFYTGHEKIAHEQLGLLAITGSLFLALLFSASASYKNWGHGQIALRHSLLIILGAGAGAALAAHWTTSIDTESLMSIFGGFLLLNGFYGLFRLIQGRNETASQNTNAKKEQVRALGPGTGLLLLLSGIAVGLLSGFTGVGGGIIIVPLLLNFFHLSPRQAVASSTFCIIFVALSSLFAYYMQSLNMQVLIPEPRIGFLYLPFVVPLALGGLAGGYLGSHFTRKIPSFYLSLLLVFLQLGIAVKILL